MTVPVLGGRPLKFNSHEELQKKINEYYDWAKDNNKPLTVERLACFLNTNRQTLLAYSRDEKYSDTIEAAKAVIIASKAEMLNTREGNTAGIIFDLCNNAGYTNSHQQAAASQTFLFQGADGVITQLIK
jgi:hypothetical protein